MKANASPTRLIELPKTTPSATTPLCELHPVVIYADDVDDDMFDGNACKCPEYRVSICKKI
jgi:hypothetical protein